MRVGLGVQQLLASPACLQGTAKVAQAGLSLRQDLVQRRTARLLSQRFERILLSLQQAELRASWLIILSDKPGDLPAQASGAAEVSWL